MIIKIADTTFNIINGGAELEKYISPFKCENCANAEFKIVLDQSQDFMQKRSVMAIAITEKLIGKNVLRIHASSICYKDKAIMFLAPSGTGKSTHASLWNKYAGAEYINDDQPYLNMDTLMVYGSMVSGKHNRFSLKQAKLFSLVFISQAEHNSIKKLTKLESVKYLYKQMVHYIDLSDRQKQLECLDILSNLPVYLLECDVSYEAFLTCYKGVFNKDYEN